MRSSMTLIWFILCIILILDMPETNAEDLFKPVNDLSLVNINYKLLRTQNPQTQFIFNLHNYRVYGQIKWVEIDSLRNNVLIRFDGADKKKWFVTYNDRLKKVLWAKQGEVKKIDFINEFYLLDNGKLKQLFYAENGSSFGNIVPSGTLVLDQLDYFIKASDNRKDRDETQDGVDVLKNYYDMTIDDSAFAANPLSGRLSGFIEVQGIIGKALLGYGMSTDSLLWNRRNNIGGWDSYFRNQDQLLLIKEGLESIDLNTGKGSFISFEAPETDLLLFLKEEFMPSF